MRVVPLEKIAEDVRIALDHNKTSEALAEIGDVDTLALNDIIKSKIVEGVKRVHSSAPSYLLDGGYNFGDSVYWEDQESGWVLLPEDYMRFVVFKMDDWSRAVYTCGTSDDPDYLKQHSRFKGIRGTAERPRCFIVARPEGRALEFYSSKSEEATVSRAMYLPYPKVDRYGGIEICERCYGSVVYTIAALVSATLGDTEKSNVMNELAKSSLI